MTKKTNNVPDLVSALTRNSGRPTTKSLTMGALPTAKSAASSSGSHPIDFGRAPETPATKESHFDVLGFLTSVASGGLTKALGGSNKSLLSGAESLVTGIAHLFGGHKAKNAAAVTAFQLADSQNTTVQIGGTISETRRTGLYGDSEWIQNNAHTVAQAVKSALLESNSLSDVISEL